MSGALALARALARPRGLARLLPARLRGALLRAAAARLLRGRGLDDVLAALSAGCDRPSPRRGAGAAERSGDAEPRKASSPSASSGISTPSSCSEETAGSRSVASATVSGLRGLPATCLHRALAGYAALRQAGEDARFVIGVRGDGGDVVAHAWLEHGGAPVGEPHDPRARFAVAYAHPDPAAEVGAGSASPGGRDVRFTALADGTGVLLHLRAQLYFALNRTGVAVWEALSRGWSADPDALAALLAARFAGVDRVRAKDDVRALLAELAAEGLLAEDA